MHFPRLIPRFNIIVIVLIDGKAPIAGGPQFFEVIHDELEMTLQEIVPIQTEAHYKPTTGQMLASLTFDFVNFDICWRTSVF